MSTEDQSQLREIFVSLFILTSLLIFLDSPMSSSCYFPQFFFHMSLIIVYLMNNIAWTWKIVLIV